MKIVVLILTVLALGSARAQLTIPITWQHQDTALRIETFRCYLSDVELIYANGRERSFKESVFLVDKEDPESMKLHFPKAPDGALKGLRFRLGTDSVLNVSGIYEGALDPINGMYWAWNTGYINLKMEGKYLGTAFEYHVGGYRQPYSTDRYLEFSFQDGNQKLVLSPAALIHFALDSNLHSVLIPGKDASLIADHYQLLFAAP